MRKERENRYPGLISISLDLKKAIATGITVPWIITPLFVVLTGCQEPKPASSELMTTPTFQLVPTYTPTPKIEVSPTPKVEATPTPEPVATSIPEEIKYKVQSGNTLLEIAEKFNLPWTAIYGKNFAIIGQNPDLVKTGQVLVIPDQESDKELIEVFHNLSRKYPEVWQELSSRVEKVIAYDERIRQIGPDFSAQETEPIEFSDLPAYQDFRIFEKHGMRERNLPLTKENLLFILAWYELEYVQPIEQNPNFQRALKELGSVMRMINEIIKDKVSPEEFIGQKTPQIPKSLQGRLLFGNDNRGGRFFPEIYVIEEMKNPDPENYQPLLEYLVSVVPHELIHAWPQNLVVNQRSLWSHEIHYEIKKGDALWDIAQASGLEIKDILATNSQIENPDLIFADDFLEIPQKGEFIWPENRKFHLAHMSMCSLTAPAQEELGFEPEIEPRIIYIYSRLKEHGVEDPYGLIVQAGATMNSSNLWEIYESAREGSDLSLDELIATNNPDPDFGYFTPEEREAFCAEYLPYLSQK